MQRIETLEELEQAVDDCRSITVGEYNNTFYASFKHGPIPAAVIFNWPGSRLLRMFREGMFIYKKKK